VKNRPAHFGSGISRGFNTGTDMLLARPEANPDANAEHQEAKKNSEVMNLATLHNLPGGEGQHDFASHYGRAETGALD
jgi:hypothetical protein